VSGDVHDGEHFVADRGNQQEIDLREKASHLFGHFPPQAVRLHEVDGGEEARLAEDGGSEFEMPAGTYLGPKMKHLSFERVPPASPRGR
jgi:hypothetical protein